MAKDTNTSGQGDLLEDIRDDLKEPEMWKVVILNDDYTPMDFVVEVLVSIFHKAPIDATKIMYDVHNKGKGIVGLYTYDIGRTKVSQVTSLAREKEYPLKAMMEQA